MTLPRTVADVLSDHVVFQIESIDRMLLNVYQPRLQHPRALVGFIHWHLGYPIASTAVLAPRSEALSRHRRGRRRRDCRRRDRFRYWR